MRKSLPIAALLVLLLSAAWPAGTEPAREIDWAVLVPPVTQAPVNMKPESFLANAQPPGGGGVRVAPQTPEAPWMSSRSRQPDSSQPPAIVSELDGQRVRIGGYVVALEFDATKIKEFLLVPFVGACIHVPPPPPNQIIYVKAAEGFEVYGQFNAAYITGTLKAVRQVTDLAATGYAMEAEKIELRRR